MRENIDYIIVHCSATPPSMDIGVDEIRKWHKERGFDDIGYHFVIRRDGSVEPGRHIDTIGAHARGFNRTSIGICLVGGLDENRQADANFTRAQYKALERLITGLAAPRTVSVLGHRDLPGVTKACPCFDVPAWWKNL